MSRPPAIVLLFAAVTGCSQRVEQAPVLNSKLKETALSTVMRRQALNAVDAGDGDYQIRVLRERVAAEPSNVEARIRLAERYARAGYPDVALEHARLAAERFPDSDRAATALAKALRRMDLSPEAAAALDNFLGRQAATADVHAWLGIIRDEIGDYAIAEKHHRAAIDLKAGSDYLHNNLGYNLHLQGRKEEAAAEFRKALAIAPQSAVARTNLGIALSNQPKDAISAWQSLDGPAGADNNMAAVLIEQGKYDDAKKELELALGYRKDHPAVLSNLRLLSELDSGELSLRADVPRGSLLKRFGRTTSRVIFGAPGPSSKETAGRTAVGGDGGRNGF